MNFFKDMLSGNNNNNNNNNNSEPIWLPEKLSLSQFLSNDTTTIKKLQHILTKHHYAIFTCDLQTIQAIQEYKAKGDEFFKSPKSEKNQYAIGQKDELIMSKVNLGYLEVTSQKEFLKLQKFLNSPEETDKHIPQNIPGLKDTFINVYDRLGTIANRCLDAVSTIQDSNGTPYFDPKFRQDLHQHDKSSISYIHYYKAQDVYGDNANNNSNEFEVRTQEDKTLDKIKQEGLVYPSSTHTDTGLLTLIICAPVPGLQVFEKEKGGWLEVEKMVEKNVDLFVVLGRK